MATYVAITAYQNKANQMPDWQVVCTGTNREEVEAQARQIIGDIRTGYGTDIIKDTKHKNLRVVTKTSATRVYKLEI